MWVESENSSHSEAENSKGGKQEPGNVEKSGQETTRPEKKNGGGGVIKGTYRLKWRVKMKAQDQANPGISKSCVPESVKMKLVSH